MSTGRNDATSSTALEIKPGMRVWVGGHDVAAKRAIEPVLSGAVRPPSGPVDAVFICPQTADEAVYFAAKLKSRLREGGAVWIVCARESGATSDDLDRRIESVRSELAALGLVGLAARRTVPIDDGAVALGFRFDLP